MLWQVSYEGNWVANTMGLKVGGAMSKDEKSKHVDDSIDVDCDTLILRNVPLEVVDSPFIRFSVENVNIFKY